MRNAILEQLLAEYEARRSENAREEAARLAQAAKVNPEIGRIFEARRDALFSALREVLSQRGQDISGRVAAEMDTYNTRLRSLLLKSGLPEDYLQPIYRCPVCRDTGYVGEPLRRRCDCLQREYFKRLCQDVGLNERTPQTFEAYCEDVFSPEPLKNVGVSQRDYMRVLRDKCLRYADSFPNTPVNDYLFMGSSGLGKTFLMQAIAHRVLERGYSALSISAFKLVELTRKAYFTNNPEESEPLFSVDLLLIDDLGVEPMMENITIVQLYHVINERQNAGLHTILSTNLTSVQLQERYTERITSRLMHTGQCELVAFIGSDIRRKS